ncbi:unnamed protein product [Dovyalis caffra]|uniref:Uncharacterized protein n=1 Tax=Dovyalis caffra TaxID=77055 RepID=A0AAV1RYZ8_9ROSI|nr:unnamed protein product [Dovyalis caffra]
MVRRIEDLEGVDASFEQLVEAVKEAADWDETKTENLVTEKVVTEFVNFHVEKAEKERASKRLKGGKSLKMNKGNKLGDIQGHDAEIPDKRKKTPDKSHVNSLPKKRLQELLERN